MDFISFVQQVLIVSAILFAVVLAVSYIYTKFLKKEKEEEPVTKINHSGHSSKSIVSGRKRDLNYTASSDSKKLYVNTEKHRKHIDTSKAAAKPQRFKILNKSDDE